MVYLVRVYKDEWKVTLVLFVGTTRFRDMWAFYLIIIPCLAANSGLGPYHLGTFRFAHLFHRIISIIMVYWFRFI